MNLVENNTRRLAILKNSNFLLLYLGGLVSWLGNNVYYVALTWYLLDKYKSGYYLGIIMMVGSLPSIICGPFSGVFVDRINRKRVLVVTDLIRGLLVLITTYLLFMDKLSISILIAVTLVMSICESFFDPAFSAIIPNIVSDKDLTKANSLIRLAGNFTGVLGMALGGILLGFCGVAGVFFYNGVSFIISAISEMFIRVPLKKNPEPTLNAPEEANSTFFSELAAGLRFLLSNKLLLSLCVTVVLMNFFFIGSLGVALPYIVKEVMHIKETGFGLMEGFFPAGAVIGAIAITLLPEMKKFYRVIVIGSGIHGILLIFIGVTVFPTLVKLASIPVVFFLVCGLILLMGIVNVLMNVPVSTLFQRIVPDEMRGRFYAIFTTLSQGLTPAAYFISGLVIGLWPPYALLLIGGIALLLVTYGLSKIRELRAL